jgi:hypothetical protein
LDKRGQQAAAPAAFGTSALIDQLSKSTSPQDQWTLKYLQQGDLPTDTATRLRNMYKKPMDAGDRQKLVAQRAAIEYAGKLEQQFESMIKSYGGEKNFTFGDQMQQYAMTLGGRIASEGVSGAFITLGSDFARAFAQRTGRPPTPEAIEFMTTYAQAQKFARGAMNDAANLATRERNMFNQMIGMPLDAPTFFRANLRSFRREIAGEYNSLLKANSLKASEGFEPAEVPPLTGSRQQAPAGLGDEWEVIAPPRSTGGEY